MPLLFENPRRQVFSRRDPYYASLLHEIFLYPYYASLLHEIFLFKAYAKTWSGVKPWGGAMEWCGFLEWFFGVGFWSHL